MTSKKFGLSNRQGFTLIEMMIVAVIIGTVASIAAPSFQQAYDRHNFKGGQQEVVSMLKKARSYAISTKDSYGVHIDSETRAVTLFENRANPSVSSFEDGDSAISIDTLPESFQYVYADMANSAIAFQPNGSALVTGYSNIFLAGETENMMAYISISVLASTGKISTYSNFYAW